MWYLFHQNGSSIIPFSGHPAIIGISIRSSPNDAKWFVEFGLTKTSQKSDTSPGFLPFSCYELRIPALNNFPFGYESIDDFLE